MTVRLLGPAEVRDLAEMLDILPSKKLGQNFVVDPNTVRRIVRLAGIGSGNTVLEVGPGLGSLTLGLLEAEATVIAVEIDGRLADRLASTVQTAAGEEVAARLTVLREDALRLTCLPADADRLVANLPYNISVPVLLHLLEVLPALAGGVVMVQAEVGHRLAAGPGSKVYGSPSVKAAWWGGWRVAGTVPRQVFWPVPNVDSVLVAFTRHPPPGDEELRRRVFALVDAAFGQRRKMLRQSMSVLFGDAHTAAAALREVGIPDTARGEQLFPADFVRLAEMR